MADESTLRVDAKDKDRESTGEEGSTWVRDERIQSEPRDSDWRLSANAEPEPGETGRDKDSQQPRECDSSTSPLFTMNTYLRRPSSSSSSTTDSLSSSQQTDMGVDCAGIVLNCLFCRFYDLILMLPNSCEGVANNCCPNYKQVVTTVESAPSDDDDDFCMDYDCGLLNSCQDASDCLELAMEVSEICYH